MISVIVEVVYLDSLPVVGLNNMEVEAVHSSPWCQEDTALLVKMSADIHQNLIQQMICDIICETVKGTQGMTEKKSPSVTCDKPCAYC